MDSLEVTVALGTTPLSELSEGEGLISAYLFHLLTRVFEKLKFSYVINTSTNLYMISAVIALFLNGTVAGVIISNRRLHKVVCLYILSLCLSHSLYSLKTLLYYPVVHYVRDSRSMATTSVMALMSSLATTNQFLSMLCFLVTMYTMAALSFHQYWSIVHVYRRQLTRRYTCVILLVTWTLSAVVSGSVIGSSRALGHHHSTPARDRCLVLALVFVFFTFFLPVTCVVVLATIAVRNLRRGSEIDDLYRDAMPLKRRALNMLITTFALFTINWSVFWFSQLYYTFVELPGPEYVYTIAVGSSLAISYTWINISVYLYFFNDLRRAFFRVFTKCLRAFSASNAVRRRSTISKSGGTTATTAMTEYRNSLSNRKPLLSTPTNNETKL